MKLTEFLKNADKDEYIYLGAMSAFLWIGKPAEIIAKLPELDEDYTEQIRESIKRNAWKIREIEGFINKNDDPYVERRLLKERERLNKRKIKLAERLEKRIPFGDREVRDVYRRRLVEPVGTCVIIKGREFGYYWTLDEVLNGEGVRELIE